MTTGSFLRLRPLRDATAPGLEGTAWTRGTARRRGLTFPAAMSDRANWYQRWNSSKANFMALSKHWGREQTQTREHGRHTPRESRSLHTAVRPTTSAFLGCLKHNFPPNPMRWRALCQTPRRPTGDESTSLGLGQFSLRCKERGRGANSSNTRPHLTSGRDGVREGGPNPGGGRRELG